MIDVNILLKNFGTVGYRPTTQDFINLIELIIGAGDASGLVTIEQLAGLLGMAQPGDAASTTPPMRLAINTSAQPVIYTNYKDAGGNAISVPQTTIGVFAYNGTAWAFNGYNVNAVIEEIQNNIGDLSALPTNDKSSLVAALIEMFASLSSAQEQIEQNTQAIAALTIAKVSNNAASAADNTLAPGTASLPPIIFNDAGALTSTPVEGAIECIKGTDSNNPNFDGGGFNFTWYTPRNGVIRERLNGNMATHMIGRQNLVRTNVLLDTNPKYFSGGEFVVRCFPVAFGTGGSVIVINISFDNGTTWYMLWTGDVTLFGGLWTGITASQPIDVVIDPYAAYHAAAFTSVTDTYAIDGTITTTKKLVQVGTVSLTNNIMVQFASVGAENVGLHYQVLFAEQGTQYGAGQ